jgi:excisionase family DNA binding protein
MLQGYLTLSQAIRKYEGVSLGHLTRLVRTGVIEGEKIGSQWVVKEESLKTWLEKKERSGAEEDEAEASAPAP